MRVIPLDSSAEAPPGSPPREARWAAAGWGNDAAGCSRPPRSDANSRRKTTRRRSRCCGPSCSMPSRAPRRVALPGHRPVCGGGRGGQGRNVKPAQRVDGSALDRHSRLHGSVGRGARASASLALLARSSARGRIALFLSAWYSSPIRHRVARRISTAEFDALLDQIAAFERALTDDGAVILKFWMHLGQGGAEEAIQGVRKGSASAVARDEGSVAALAHVRPVRRRSRPCDPPHQHRSGALAHRRGRRRAVPERRRRHDAARRHPARSRARRSGAGRRRRNSGRAHSRGSRRRSADRREDYNVLDQSRHESASRTAATSRPRSSSSRDVSICCSEKPATRAISTIVVFEGWDAAGKGGAIRRVTAALDARDYQVIPIGAPTDEERSRHYLWRFWRHLSRAGRITIFDRSWYGRVLVERVEGFATEAE